MESATKKCHRCEANKPLDAFPSHWKSLKPIKTCRTCMPQYRRGGKPERAHKRKWTIKNAEKRSAHKVVEYAIANGKLLRSPCERCGESDKIYAHHDDYSKPLDVMWLCSSCHFTRHKEIGRPMGGKVATSFSGARPRVRRGTTRTASPVQTAGPSRGVGPFPE